MATVFECNRMIHLGRLTGNRVRSARGCWMRCKCSCQCPRSALDWSSTSIAGRWLSPSPGCAFCKHNIVHRQKSNIFLNVFSIFFKFISWVDNSTVNRFAKYFAFWRSGLACMNFWNVEMAWNQQLECLSWYFDYNSWSNYSTDVSLVSNDWKWNAEQ